jgi:glycolate oxidase iron-sulfur subunit
MVTAPASPPTDRFLDEQKSLACIHCGLCLSSCPTYLETGNENLSPRGRIYLMRAIQDGRLPVEDASVQPIDLCLGCRACEAVCPSGVEYGALLEATRDHVEKHHRRSWFQSFLRRIAIEKVFPYPGRLKLALLPARLINKAGAAHLFPKFAREALALVPSDCQATELPELSPATPRSSRREEALNFKSEIRNPKSEMEVSLVTPAATTRVGFVSGCAMSVMFGRTNQASVALLNRAGCDVVTPPAQVCCGALHAHGGRLDDARALARRNIAAFEPLDLDAIIINAAGCGSTLKEYGHLLAHDPQWADRAAAFSAKVKDLTEFLAANQGAWPPFRTPHSALRVTYHDACHLAHAQRITQPPRELVKAVAGDRYVELPEADVCCGSAGTYNLTEPEMAARLQRRKVENILQTGAEIVVTSNPGCILQMQAGLKAAGAGHVRVLHIADYLLESVP